MATKREGTLWLNWNALMDISKGGKPTQSIGVVYDEQGAPHTLFAQTHKVSEEKRGQLVRDKNGNYCLVGRSRQEDGGKQLATFWMNLDGFTELVKGERAATLPLGYAFYEGSEVPKTIFAICRRSTGEAVRSKENGLYGFNIRERLQQVAG